MKKQNRNVTEIRSRGLSQVNRIVAAHKELPLFKEAFAEWRAGDIYICKKTGDYRHRYGVQCRSVASWSAAVRKAFSTVSLFALAAQVFYDGKPVIITKPTPAPAVKKATATTKRVNIIQLAKEVAA